MSQQPQFEAKWYYNLSLERLVPEDHLLRLIANVVDFSFIRPLCRPFYSHTGRPSVDPVVLFKMLLIGYLYGITSERRLARELSLNLAYRWFLGYDFDQVIPDHSVLSKARARFGPEVFETFFHRSIDLCREAGLLEEGPVYVDSTLIQASAAVDLMVPKEERLQPPLAIEEYVQRLYRENDQAPSQDEGPSPPPGPASPYRRRGRSSQYLHPNQVLESKTDPDATLVNRPEFGRHLAYKAHVAVAGKKGQVITAAVATTGIEADEHLLAEVLWQHRRLSGLKLGEVVADAKYGTSFNFLYLGRLGLKAFIPLTRFGNMRKDIWGRGHFQWLAAEDAYLCPAGKKLRRFQQQRSTQRVIYRAPTGSCSTCAFRAQCSPSGHERSIGRSWGQETADQTEELLAAPLGRRRLIERKTYIEGSFGLAKELHGLRRTRFRGRYRVQVQLWLTAAAMNIKRAARRLATRGRPVPALALLLQLLISCLTRMSIPCSNLAFVTT